ncbi:MAG: GIY-YIG nuclease family protein, partial [Candidatus Marinimicrobia bacterium]|nr:GIY-YIG nuclease family protein [Candidatus Neomarinimicrobiota bacterium]
MYTVYVLKSTQSKFHYIGHTKNLSDRLGRHNRGQVRSTKAYRPFTVIYTEEYPTKSAAQQREYYL